MNTVLMITVALLPAILLFVYIWRKDPQKEPKRWLLKAVCWGMLTCIPVALLELGIMALFFGVDGAPTTIFGTTVQTFFVAAIPEESIKLLALWLVLRKNPYFDEHFDGVVYAVCVGLGFAAVENIFYVVSGDDHWVGVAVGRSLLAVPGHYAYAVLMGYYYSLYHFVDRSPRIAACILLVPVLAHGIYDSIVMAGSVDIAIGGVGFIVLIFFCVKMHLIAKRKIQEQIDRDEG